MSFGDVATRSGGTQGDGAGGPLADRLSLGVAARLSRYLQVLTQARKMGKETISSQELCEYTHVNSTQIRRDLSGFGKFGKRGVGYNVDSLVSPDPQDPADLRPAQHRAVRRRPPRQGDRLLATSSPTTASASSRSSTPTTAKIGEKVGNAPSAIPTTSSRSSRRRTSSSASSRSRPPPRSRSPTSSSTPG